MVKVRPEGFVCTVTCIFGVKFAVSVIGPFIVTLAGLVVPLNDPVPVPLRLPKLKPAFGVAEIFTVCPLLKKALDGLTVPPVPALIVRRNCAVKLAVYVAALEGATVWLIAPASLQLLQTYCVPVAPLCGEVVLIV